MTNKLLERKDSFREFSFFYVNSSLELCLFNVWTLKVVMSNTSKLISFLLL